VNSSKGNNFPSMNYLNPFIKIQYEALQTFLKAEPNSIKTLQDYSLLFKIELKIIASMSLENFSLIIKNNMKPSYLIGKNMGFQSDWIYR
jgi:hypothetical protein